jgi:hypothetical protein
MAPDKVSTAASYTASVVTTVAGLTINEWVAIGGLMIGLCTFLTNVWYRRQQLKIQREAAKNGQRLDLG